MEKYKGLSGREKLIEELTEKYSAKAAETLTFIQAGCGQGKSYIINRLFNSLSSKEISIFANYEDELREIEDHDAVRSLNAFGFSLGVKDLSLGISLGWQTPTTQYERIRNMLAPQLKKNLLFCIDGIDQISVELRCLIIQIINNIPRLEKEYNKRIFMLITGTQDKYWEVFVIASVSSELITLPKYEVGDIKLFLKKQKKLLKVDSDKIYKLCRGNLNLVDFLYNEIAIQNNDYLDTLNDIVKRRLAIIKSQGMQRELNEKDMEEIIFSASLAIKKFTAQFLKNIIEKNVSLIKDGLDIACDEDLLKKDIKRYYGFISEEIQDYISEMTAEKREDLFISYYNYYAQNEPDEYFTRGYYIYKYQGYLGDLAEALFLLAYSFSRKIFDELKVKEIENIFYTELMDENKRYRFTKVKKFYDDIFNESEVSVISANYDELQEISLDWVVMAQISCEYFEYLYRKTPMTSPTSDHILNICIEYAQNELILDDSEINGLVRIDETILRLKIIYSVAPCVLDQKNNYEKFQELYDLSKDLSRTQRDNKQKNIGEYIENVFNRKAFLFVNQAVCDNYYEKAKRYFLRNEIWIEYYITLSCQAGTYIVIQEFEKAIGICKKVKRECAEKDIQLPQIEKLENNEIIAKFLLDEKQSQSTMMACDAAKKALKKLKDLISTKINATQYVIYTNICSLCLYIGDKRQYLKYKNELEELYGCNDISDISDESVDDFYRYYFAWYELYYAIGDDNWEKAGGIADSLENFIPALFRKQEIFWKAKIDAVKVLISNKEKINAYDFCNNLVQTKRQEQILSKFFYRGLMVSDIQYTSYF